MLDRVEVMAQLRQHSASIFSDITDQRLVALDAWHALSKDPLFSKKCADWDGPWKIPRWRGVIEKIVATKPLTTEYAVCGIDGSQIYPDRHRGNLSFLINIGTVCARYGCSNGSFFYNSVPHVFIQRLDEEGMSEDGVDAVRQEFEFEAAVNFSSHVSHQPQTLLLFDGSLIFWHLEQAHFAVQQRFSQKYVHALSQLADCRRCIAGYISLPRNKDLMLLIKLFLADFDINDSSRWKCIASLQDVHLASALLQPGERTTVFESNCPFVWAYRDDVRPFFFYIHTGYEIARVEIPRWIAQEEDLLDFVASVTLDQAQKGFGYPMVLAEAHEQAVVKSADREFFYQLLQRLAVEQKQWFVSSYKSFKKRVIGI